MGPFDFIILFISFIYTLALTHILFAMTRMVRHRRELTVSWPHLLWMADALILLSLNWVSLWDLHHIEPVPLKIIVMGLLFSMAQYFLCALVSPDFDDGETFDMTLFYGRERRTFLLAFLAVMILALVANFSMGGMRGLERWNAKNLIVGGMTAAVLIGLVVRRRAAAIMAPLLFMVLAIAYLVRFYPELG